METGVKKFRYKDVENRLALPGKSAWACKTRFGHIPDFRYSKTYKCWHVPENEVSLKHLKTLFPDYSYTDKIPNDTNKQSTNKALISIDKTHKRFFVKHPINKELWNELRDIENAYWQKERKQWIFKGNNETYKLVIAILKKHQQKIITQTEPSLAEKETNAHTKTFIEALILKNYSTNTIEAYLPHFKKFALHFEQNAVEKLSNAEIQEYVYREIEENQLQQTAQLHLMSAIKFFYEKMTGRSKIYFKRKESYAINTAQFKPETDEILACLPRIKTYGSKLLFLLHYGYGFTPEKISQLQLSELKDFIHAEIKEETTFSPYLKIISIEYYNEKQPQKFVFEAKPSIAYSAEEMEYFRYKLLETYQLTEIYKAEMRLAVQQANFEYNTEKNYVNGFLSFLKNFKFRHPKHISDNEIRQYLLELRTKYKLSSSYINNQINLIKFYYTHVLHRKIDFHAVLRPKAEKKLPTVLSTAEVARMIENTENLKHKNMIALLYASGLRRSELLNMRIKDIDFERNVVIVNQGKGKKDRQTLLSDAFKLLLEQYLKVYQPKEYLFEGATGGKYSEASLEKVVRQSSKRANILKHVTPHSLRHSFATHLLENAVDIRYIQELLGHTSIKTTERYTHVAITAKAKITSPLDKLDIKNTQNNLEKPP